MDGASDEFYKKTAVEREKNIMDSQRLSKNDRIEYEIREDEFKLQKSDREKFNEITRDERIKTESYRIFLDEQGRSAPRPLWSGSVPMGPEEAEKAAERRRGLAERRVDLRDKQESMSEEEKHLKSQREFINERKHLERSNSSKEKESERIKREARESQKARGSDDLERDC